MMAQVVVARAGNVTTARARSRPAFAVVGARSFMMIFFVNCDLLTRSARPSLELH